MTDYEQLLQEYKRTVHRLTQLYSNKTHFVDELIQNADDSRSRCMELLLGEKELYVWNDGSQFSEEDVSSICSIGLSNKDLNQIGTFGIGFVAVYNYTDLPEIYSGNKRFRIRDYRKREDIDNVDSKVTKQIDKGRTVFRLPFKDRLDQKDITSLKKRLCNLEQSLLFLRHLKTVRWCDERDGQMGSYSCRRQPHGTIQNALQVELIASINGNNQLSETFLVFRREAQPPQTVIDELLQQSEEDEEQHRIQRSAKQQQPVEVAFKLRDGRITAMDSCVLFAYLPTQKETHLRFLIQGRYQTTPARDNIPNDNPWTDNPWNQWLVRETANFLPEVLEQLKAGGLLEPMFFNVLPVEDDKVPPEFAPIAEALKAAMKDRPFVPTQDGGHEKAENVFYPHNEDLQKLVKSSWLHPDSSWLHPDIRDNEKFRRCFKVMREAGVREVSINQTLGWLEKLPLHWFEGRPNEWLCSLYVYLKGQRTELERIKKLPLVRLENGKHVCASDRSVFFPPETREERTEIESFLNELPILMSTLLEGDERNDIEAFLKNLGVRPLNPEALIREWIIPQYTQSDNSKPSVEENRLHLRYLFKVWDKIGWTERNSLKGKISERPILRAYKSAYRSVQRKTYDFVAPCNAYLPQAYTENADLETYFSVSVSVSGADVWFVDNRYLESDSERRDWLEFLKEIGATDVPRFLKHYPDTYDEDLEVRNIKREKSTREETIEEYYFDGVHCVLDAFEEPKFSQVFWRLLAKAVSLEQGNRDALFQATYSWFYRHPKEKTYDADYYLLLQNYCAWLPDEQSKLRYPSECFAPTAENRGVLGDSVAYLHRGIDISNEPARWLAEKLGVHLNADTESVLNYLQSLNSTIPNIKNIEPLYRFLNRQDARPREKFKEESLIFTPNPEPSWWRSNQVFWVDESAVFGNLCGYLEEHYTETLKSFFIDLGIPERASRSDYVCGIRKVASTAQASDAEVRKRVKVLYSRLWSVLQEGDSLLEDENWQKEWELTHESRCWLGKKGNEWGFFYLEELVCNDHNHRAQFFEGKIPFWEFDDLLELATKYLGVDGCSQAEVKFYPSGEQEKDENWSDKIQDLRPYIHAFLKSPSLCGRKYEEVKSDQILDQLSVRLAQKLETTYKLKGIFVADPEPRPSCLDTTDQEVTLWLGLEADKDEYPELIGDALADYFGIEVLSQFVEDLLSKKDREKVLSRWKRKGLQPDFSPPEAPSEEDEEKLVDTSDEDSTSIVDNSVEDKTEDYSYSPQPVIAGTGSRGGHQGGMSYGGGGGGGHGGGGGEGHTHKALKEYLANNPSQLGANLKLVQTEYIFISNDRVDILLKDSSGKPITVEVKREILPGSESEVLQAVKYKHLAADKYKLPCEQVRSILVAPEIPDDVKAKCRALGIETREVTVPL